MAKQEFTYRDYLQKMGRVYADTAHTYAQVMLICEKALAEQAALVTARLKDESNLLQRLSEDKVLQVFDVIAQAVRQGARLYATVTVVNGIKIETAMRGAPLSMVVGSIGSEDARKNLLERYDVEPVIQRLGDTVSDNFLSENPDFLGYPYEQTQDLRDSIQVAIETAYITCLAICKNKPSHEL